MASGAARNYGMQLVHYVRRRVQFNDPGIAAGVRLARLPEGSYIGLVIMHVVTAFNSASADTIQLGTTQNAADILAATSVHTAGLNHGITTLAAAPGLGKGATNTPGFQQDIWVKWIGTGAAPTTGDCTVILFYCPDNDM